VNTSILSLGNIGPGIYNLTNHLTVAIGLCRRHLYRAIQPVGAYNSVST